MWTGVSSKDVVRIIVYISNVQSDWVTLSASIISGASSPSSLSLLIVIEPIKLTELS